MNQSNGSIITIQPGTQVKFRILTPFESDKILAGSRRLENRRLLNIMLYTGMRYEEIRRLYDHPEWLQLDRENIHLDRYAQRKAKRTTPERDVRIMPVIKEILPYFFDGPKPPVYNVINRNLTRWARRGGVHPFGITARTLRKTWESWLFTEYGPSHAYLICNRQGHSLLTSMKHYQGLPFTEVEKVEIKKRVQGWV